MDKQARLQSLQSSLQELVGKIEILRGTVAYSVESSNYDYLFGATNKLSAALIEREKLILDINALKFEIESEALNE